MTSAEDMSEVNEEWTKERIEAIKPPESLTEFTEYDVMELGMFTPAQRETILRSMNLHWRRKRELVAKHVETLVKHDLMATGKKVYLMPNPMGRSAKENRAWVESPHFEGAEASAIVLFEEQLPKKQSVRDQIVNETMQELSKGIQMLASVMERASQKFAEAERMEQQ